ncbi:hypothetical protein KC872_04870, partial [Candidatus Kaiserbacteria bacterium]|nr:hypothetical protein [Candidatus Kaiserbacteria bacterium]
PYESLIFVYRRFYITNDHQLLHRRQTFGMRNSDNIVAVTISPELLHYKLLVYNGHIPISSSWVKVK